MTTGIPSVLGGFVSDEPFDLDWGDVCERSRRINADGSERSIRNRAGAIRVRWRLVIAATMVIAAIAIPLTAFGFGLVFSSPPPTVALVQSGPIQMRIPKGFSSAGSSRIVNVAGRRRQVSILVAADFRLRPPFDLQAPPRPPADRFVVSITHFPARGAARQWPIVKTLQLPEQPRKMAVVRARLDGEALLTNVRFGSNPTPDQVASVDAFLAGIRNNQN